MLKKPVFGVRRRRSTTNSVFPLPFFLLLCLAAVSGCATSPPDAAHSAGQHEADSPSLSGGAFAQTALQEADAAYASHNYERARHIYAGLVRSANHTPQHMDKARQQLDRIASILHQRQLEQQREAAPRVAQEPAVAATPPARLAGPAEAERMAAQNAREAAARQHIRGKLAAAQDAVSYTHLRAHET